MPSYSGSGSENQTPFWQCRLYEPLAHFEIVVTMAFFPLIVCHKCSFCVDLVGGYIVLKQCQCLVLFVCLCVCLFVCVCVCVCRCTRCCFPTCPRRTMSWSSRMGTTPMSLPQTRDKQVIIG